MLVQLSRSIVAAGRIWRWFVAGKQDLQSRTGWRVCTIFWLECAWPPLVLDNRTRACGRIAGVA